jgi:hypothetical protein
MAMEQDPVGPADVQYNDWKGTVALDNPQDDDALYELAELKRDEWTIVGVDLYGGSYASAADVYAVERSRVSEFADWARIAAEDNGNIPVTRFRLVPGQEGIRNFGAEVLSKFKRWSIHARLNDAIYEPGFDLVVERTEERTDQDF